MVGRGLDLSAGGRSDVTLPPSLVCVRERDDLGREDFGREDFGRLAVMALRRGISLQ